MPRSVRKIGIVLAALVVLAAAGMAALQWFRPRVTATEAVLGPVVQAFYATGTVVPDREYDLRSNVAGTVTQVLVDKGDAVQAGQPVAVVSSDDLEFRVRQARAELQEKQQLAADESSPVLAEFDARQRALDEVVAIAQRELARIRSLLERGGSTQQDLDRSLERVQTAVSEAQANRSRRAARRLELQKELAVAQAALEIAQWNLDQATLRSPVDGVVLDRPISQGVRVAVNDHVMQIADIRPDNLVMRAAVDEEDKTLLFLGQMVRMTLYAFREGVFTGQVTQIYDVAESQRRTFEVDVTIEASDPRRGQLSPGMTGELAFIVSEKPRAVVVPAQAWQQGALWKVEQGRLERTPARIGLQGVERIEVMEGIEPGERVLISPLGSMEEGQLVRVHMVDPAMAAGLEDEQQQQEGTFRGFK